ncbi:hypothetical protein BHM03_00052313 [Ensete ventricosum]|nr:hypothetical protein BHM03_00052313 [Ensete ventricosum]
MGQLPHAGVDLWSLIELHSLRVYCDVPKGVAYPRSEDLDWLALTGEASLFMSPNFVPRLALRSSMPAPRPRCTLPCSSSEEQVIDLSNNIDLRFSSGGQK